MTRATPLIPLLQTSDAGFETAFCGLEGRRESQATEIDSVAAAIVADVRARGDDALLEATLRYDGYRLEAREIALAEAEIAAGATALCVPDREALELMALRVRRFHERSIPESWLLEDQDGKLGQRVRPLERVGIYVPAGRAPLASTVLMLAIPARVAGVGEIIMASPGRSHHPAVLAAARLAGVTRVLRIGGAQAIAALAYGTASVPRVDKILGPGNAYVQAAKRRVFGQVAIDAEAGPSEVLILADESARPDWVAADLLAQAEHDTMASVVLVSTSEALVRATLDELHKQLDGLPLERVARQALAEHSALIVTRDLDESLELANRYAPEHLQIMTRDPEACLARIEHAGAIFLGPHSPVPIGDYVAGPSHVLPTGGTSRFFSVLGVEDFLKRSSIIELSPGGLRRIGEAAVRLAELEGLGAHARAVRRRLDPSS